MSYEPKIGKQLVRMLMFQLYPEAETIYREYLQNACDSILKAIDIGFLKPNDACIDIKIDAYKNKIEILDNGTGIQSCFVEQVLKDVAISQKQKEKMSAGQFGIGRLVGGGYCKHLIFETSYEGEDKKSILIFDIDKTDLLLKEENNLDASQLINEVTILKTEPYPKEHRFFKVTLKDIKPEYSEILLNEEKIKNYLVQVAPLSYKAEFKKELLDKAIDKLDIDDKNKYLERLNHLNQVKICLNDEDIVKQYSLNIDGTSDQIEELRLFDFYDQTENNIGELAWGWYAISKFSTQISDFDIKQGNKPVLTRGIRLRDHNIQIGKQDYLNEYFKQARSNLYFIGEIHIINNGINPTTDRSGIAPSWQSVELDRQISDFFRKELESLYQNANKLKKSIERKEKAQNDFEEISKKEINKTYTKELKENDLDSLRNSISNADDELLNFVKKSEKNNVYKSLLNAYKESNNDIFPVIEEPKIDYNAGDKGSNKEDKKIKSPNIVAPNPTNNNQTIEERIELLKDKFNPKEFNIVTNIVKILDTCITTKEQKNKIFTEIIKSLLKMK